MNSGSTRWWEFGRREAPGPDQRRVDAPPASGGEGAETPVTEVLDVLASLVRLLGEVPVLPDQPEIAQVRETCETWARHVLTLQPPPAAGNGAADGPAGQRAWGPLMQFVANQRHHEQEAVATALGDMRAAVATIAEAVRGALVTERAGNDTVREIVGGLQTAADVGSLSELRQEVRRTADHILELANERDERQAQLSLQVIKLSDQVQSLADEVRQANQASSSDGLTGLLNRSGFDAAVRRELKLHLRSGRALSLALIDLDDLKWVNDHHGHSAGDAAIRALADSLRSACRITDVLARIGGDEFAAILIDAPPDQVEGIVQRFLHELWGRNLAVGDETIRVSASVGTASLRANDGPQSWIDRADQWLYRAKALGKNRVLGDLSPPAAGQEPSARAAST